VAGVITVFSLSDMIIYNRKQRSLFYATQAAIYTQTLQRAIAAQAEGRPLTDEETLVLNREKAVLQAEAAKEERQSLPWKQRIFGGGAAEAVEELGGQKVSGDAEVDRRDSLADVAKEEGVQGAVKPVGEVIAHSRVMQALREKKGEGERPLEEVHAIGQPLQQAGAGEHSTGGQLDRLAEEVAEKAKQGVDKAKGGWSSWFGGQRR
ncbi:MAG: hypothetical protein Q9207_004781, partial [Kuettlingeria erythrocarpa]